MTLSDRLGTFWMPVLASVVITPLVLLVGVGSAGAGHGDYLLAKVLFPVTMLSTIAFNHITTTFVWLAVIYYPALGVILGFANTKGRFKATFWTLLAMHFLAAVTSVIAIGENYS